MMIATDCSGVSASVIGSGVYGTVVEGRIHGNEPGDVVIKIQYMCTASCITGGGDVIGHEVEEDVVMEGAIAAFAKRTRDPTGVFAMRFATVITCQCCRPPERFALFAYNVAPGQALMKSTYVHGHLTHAFAPRLHGVVLRRFAFEMARSLAALHALRVYHGDMKPAHVYVDGATGDGANMRVTLLDLGFLCEEGRVRRWPTYTGWWRAPEAWDPELVHSVGKPADIFALALCLTCAATGTTHYKPSTLNESRAYSGRLPHVVARLMAPLDTALSAIMCRCVSVDADRRPSAAQLVDSLGTLSGAAPPGWSLGEYVPPRETVLFGDGVARAPVLPPESHLEAQLHMFRTYTMSMDAIRVVGHKCLWVAVDGVENSARRIYARLVGWIAHNATHAAIMLALKLHWPLRTSYSQYEFQFDDPCTLQGYRFIATGIKPPAASAALVQRALAELEWDLFA